MPFAMFTNADAGIQRRGSIIRTGLVAGTCLLALADSGADVTELLGARLDDVLPTASGTLAGFQNGLVVRLAAAALVDDMIYLSDTVPGVGTNVPPAIRVLLGTAYAVTLDGGVYYASLIQSSYIPQIPVPAPNSTANIFSSDVVGNKEDDENGSSIYTKGFRSDRHVHSAAMVYPTLAVGVNVTKSATPWTLGAFAVVIPTGTITDSFDIHAINFDDVPTNGVYEIVLYGGPNGSEVEIGRTRFTRTAASDIELESLIMTPINAPGTQVKAKLAGSNSAATVVTISLRLHTY